MKRNILVFGGISGIIVATFMGISMAYMASHASESNHGAGSMIIGFASMAAAFSFVFVAIKNYRDKQNGGVITFGKGFLLGFLVSLIASTIYVITWALEYHFLYPDFMEKYTATQIKQLQQSGISGTVYDQAVKELQSAKDNYENNSFFFTIYTYLEILPVGILITLISALILRRKVPVTA